LHRKDEVWTAFALKQDRPVNPIFSQNGIRIDHPSKMSQATVFARGLSYICTGYGCISPNPSLRSKGLLPFLHDVAADHHWYVEFIQLSEDAAIALAHSIQNGTIMAVSDGSYQDSYATTATIIEDLSSGQRGVNKIIAPRGREVMSVYRADLTGIFSTVWLVNQICT
jgi:hypothetical protein